MKNRVRTGLFFFLVLSMTIPMSNATAALADENFYKDLGELLSGQDDTFYFDTMELKIGSNTLSVDGELQTLDVAPEITNNRTMLPIRAIAETAGATVEWDQSTSTVLIESAYGDEISCTIGTSTISVNDEITQLDVASYVKDGRTFLPVRAVAEALDMDVEWMQDTAAVVLSSPYQSARLIAEGENVDITGLNIETALNDGSGFWVFQFSTPAEAKNAAQILQARGVAVEPDRYIPPIDGDISVHMSGHTLENASWGVDDCGFPTFIDKYSYMFTGREVVAVVDTGVEASHSLLRGRVLNGYDFVDGDSDTSDDNSHGTLVAGTIIDCVGSSPVTILAVRVMNSRGSGTSSAVAAGIRYAVSHGADVVNLSLGGEGHSYAIESAIDYAISNGAIVVIAAGNSNTNTINECPAHVSTPGALVISAGDSNHVRASFSNYGDSVDLMAPGVNVKAPTLGNTYRYASGTSIAAPHVSAAAALLDLAWGQSLTSPELENKVRSASTYGSWRNASAGYGFLDLAKAEAPRRVDPSIALSKSNLSMLVGDTQRLVATASPSASAISWRSSNNNVVSVDNSGIITAVGTGTANVEASISVNDRTYSASCTVSINLPSISLSHNSLSMKVGDILTITASTTANGASIVWSSNMSGVATVSQSGSISALSQGDAIITAQLSYGGRQYSDSCSVTVLAVEAPPTISGQWTTDKLPNVPGYAIETKTQYRTRDKQTTSSSQSTLTGWTLYDQITEYGDWSAWSEWLDGQVIILNGNGNREIENRSYESGRTRYYELYYYKYWNTNYNTYYYTYASSMGGTKHTTTALASDCTPYRSYDGHQAYTYDGHNLWWVERAYDRITYVNEHRERTREQITTYYYYRWGDWSEWLDGSSSSSSSTEVESRVLYRYIPT